MSLFPRSDLCSMFDLWPQILTGTTPFSDKSDEDISAEVITGLRPEWPSDDPSQALIDGLWRQVEACWCYDPEERPTALIVFHSLQAFVQERARERPQETRESLKPAEPADDDTWDDLEDVRELGSLDFLCSYPWD